MNQVNTKFHDLLEKAVRIVESRKTETKYSSDNYSANNRTVGARNFDRGQRHDSHNSDSCNRNQSNGTNDDNDQSQNTNDNRHRRQPNDRYIPKCYNCGEMGHIKPNCHHQQNYSSNNKSGNQNQQRSANNQRQSQLQQHLFLDRCLIMEHVLHSRSNN